MKKYKYHRDKYFPSWAGERISEFISYLHLGRLVYTEHALLKLVLFDVEIVEKINNLLDSINLNLREREEDRLFESTFEFVVTENFQIEKICTRLKLEGTKFDVVFVISSAGRIITLFLNQTDDQHTTLNLEEYSGE